MVNAPSVSGSESEEEQQGIISVNANQTQTPRWATHDQAGQTQYVNSIETGTETEPVSGTTVATQTTAEAEQPSKLLHVETQTQTN